MLRYKTIFTLLLTIFLFISCSHYKYATDGRQTPPVKHDLPIVKDQNRWIVKTPRVTKGDTLVWVAPKTSDLSFQFPSNISRYLKPLSHADQLTDDYLKNLNAGQSLRLVVKNNAPSYRILEYAIFIVSEGKYAEGDTPPEIIVEW